MKCSKKLLAAVLCSSMLLAAGCAAADTPEKLDIYPEVSANVPAAAGTDGLIQQSAAPEAPLYNRGTIYDINGRVIVSTVQQSVSDAYRSFSEEYASTLANLFADTANGFDEVFSPVLRQRNVEAVNIYDSIGQSVRLSLDAELSSKLVGLLEAENIRGSVVVMRKDGSIAAMASAAALDLLRLGSEEGYAESLDGTGAFTNRTLALYPPGSVFKMASEVIADMSGINVLTDEGKIYRGGSSIQNWDWEQGGYYPVDRSRLAAFASSSNVYFAKIFEMTGQETVQRILADVFMFGDEIEIACDFGTLTNTLSIESDDDLMRTGFGQANVRTSPLYLAALTREAVYGSLVRPFMLYQIVNTRDYTQQTGEGSKPYDTLAEIPAECREHLRECMAAVGSELDLSVPEGYTLYAKTGTAQTQSADCLYICGGLVSDHDDIASMADCGDYSGYPEIGSYIIVMQIENSDDLELSYASSAAPYYEKIISLVVPAQEGEQ